MKRNSRRSLILTTARKIIDLSGAVIGSVIKEMANVENDECGQVGERALMVPSAHSIIRPHVAYYRPVFRVTCRRSSFHNSISKDTSGIDVIISSGFQLDTVSQISTCLRYAMSPRSKGSPERRPMSSLN